VALTNLHGLKISEQYFSYIHYENKFMQHIDLYVGNMVLVYLYSHKSNVYQWFRDITIQLK
jgi:hypothetical protein